MIARRNLLHTLKRNRQFSNSGCNRLSFIPSTRISNLATLNLSSTLPTIPVSSCTSNYFYKSHSSIRRMSSTSTFTSNPREESRGYSEAISCLNSLQSNAAVIEQIRLSGGKLNELAMPEFIEYLQVLGYAPDDLNRLNVIHITGTKGKGSTAAFCNGLLNQVRPENAKIGLYTSPHLVAVRERIRINGLPISESLFAKYFWQVWDRLGSNPHRSHPTTPLRPVYFRFLTLLAFHTFIQEKVIATILEVGIGGLYDSTNVVPRPVVAGVSALGLDHTALLGNTIGEIAVQKGGIYKKEVPALSVVQRENGREVLRKVAGENESPFYPIPIPAVSEPISLGLAGPHQLSNASLALHLIRIFLNSSKGKEAFPKAFEFFNFPLEPLDPSSETLDDQSIKTDLNLSEIERKGLENSRWPGRCQIVKPPLSSGNDDDRSSMTFYLDGAHTTDSLALCASWFVEASSRANREKKPLKALIFNCTNGRKSEELLGATLGSVESSLKGDQVGQEKVGDFKLANQYFDEVRFCTNTTFKDGASAGDLTSVVASTDSSTTALVVQQELKTAFEKLTPGSNSNVQIEPSIQDAIESITSSNDREIHVLVAGSLHLVGGVMAHLKDWGWLDESLKSVRE